MKRKTKISVRRDGLDRRILSVGEHTDGSIIIMIPHEEHQSDGLIKNSEHQVEE